MNAFIHDYILFLGKFDKDNSCAENILFRVDLCDRKVLHLDCNIALIQAILNFLFYFALSNF